MTNKFKQRVRAYAKAEGMSYQAAFQAIGKQEGKLMVDSNVIFETEDPVSPEWRAAWGRYVKRMLDPFETEFEAKIIKEVHHRGWRAGVGSVRRQLRTPGCPSHYTPGERRSWEHGAVAGRQAARAYIEAQGIVPEKLH
jgi:hypothetical protein